MSERIGPGEWITITQEMIDNFANATGDREWIHIDVERAKRQLPSGKTIAHGYQILSLNGVLQPTLYELHSARTLNYGIDKLRFLNAAPVGSRLRLNETIKSVEEASTECA
jgi:acyl dehydratase